MAILAQKRGPIGKIQIATWVTAGGDPIAATSRITVLTSILVIIAAVILSFTALRDLFLAIGLFSPWLAWLFPLLFDLAEIAAAVSVLNARLIGDEDRFAWRLVLFFTGLGIVANIAHAVHAYTIGRIDGGQVILALLFTSLFPLSVALATHLLKRNIARQINRHETATTLAELTAAATITRQRLNKLTTEAAAAESEIQRQIDRAAELKAEVATLQRQKQQAKRVAPAEVSVETEAAARQILAEWVAAGRTDRQIVGSELGRRLGKSERLGRDLKRRLLPKIRSTIDQTSTPTT